jgi:hypothetical protein
MKRVYRLFAIALAVGLMTCSGSEPAGPGWLDVRLTSPNADDGGVMFTVRGARIDSVGSTHPDLFTNQVNEREWEVIVVGNVASTVIARIWVPSLDAAAQYSATLEQVASGTTFEQRALAGYSITVERAN